MASVYVALPVLAWTTRQVLDAEPDDQVLLSALAVGGRPLRASAEFREKASQGAVTL